jgi:hypothetical protein
MWYGQTAMAPMSVDARPRPPATTRQAHRDSRALALARAAHRWTDRRLLPGKLTRGFGFGVVGDIAIGIIGAFFGTWLLAMFGIFIGAVLLLATSDSSDGMRKACTMRWSTHSPLPGDAPTETTRHKSNLSGSPSVRNEEARYTCIIGDIHGKRAEKIEPRNQEAEKDSRRARQDGGRAHQCRRRTGGWLVRQKRKGWPNAALTDRTEGSAEEAPCKPSLRCHL